MISHVSKISYTIFDISYTIFPISYTISYAISYIKIARNGVKPYDVVYDVMLLLLGPACSTAVG